MDFKDITIHVHKNKTIFKWMKQYTHRKNNFFF